MDNTHHQRDVWVSIRDYQNFGEEGIDRRWNTNGGILNGEEYSLRRNFYNKPLTSLNWDWDINSNLKLTYIIIWFMVQCVEVGELVQEVETIQL